MPSISIFSVYNKVWVCVNRWGMVFGQPIFSDVVIETVHFLHAVVPISPRRGDAQFGCFDISSLIHVICL